ncbi:MFS transporter [Escherichia coli]|nr:MFS transporter [Escherichia coli]EFC4086826.1 MFS transporter [Escherichia coli]EFH2504830.1 MFS transporter [Escherichia coli]
MLTKKKWALFSLLTLCGGTIYKLPSLKDAFYIPMQEYFHLTNGQIGNAMSVNSFVTTVGFFLSIYFADKLPRRYTMSFSLIATGLLGVYIDDNAGVLGHPLCLGAIWRYLRHDELAGLAQVGKSIGQ